MRFTMFLATATALTCASGQTPTKERWDVDAAPTPASPAAAAGSAGVSAAPPAATAPAAAPMPRGTPAQLAKSFGRPHECEGAARRNLVADAEFSWQLLKACVEKGGFTLLKTLLTGPWLDEMKKRPDAGEVLAAVIAARGGDVAGDMDMVKQHKIFLFDLGMASKAADRIAGKFVVFRAQVGDGKPKAKGYSMEMAELGMFNQYAGDHAVEGKVWKSTVSGSARGSYETSRYGSGKGQVSYGRKEVSGQFKERYENKVEETGRMIWASGDTSDPFLVPGRDLVILAKLDGVKTLSTPSDDEEPEQRFLVRVVKYWEPSKAMVFRE